MFHDIAYFDYAATTFMPERVISVIDEYHRTINMAPYRGNSILSKTANEQFEDSRINIRSFFVDDTYNLIFYPGASYGLNAIVYGLEHMIHPMDVILLGPYEHHSNYLPWRELSHRTGAIVFEMPLLEDGSINLEYLESIKEQVKIVAFSSIANTNGYRIDVQLLRGIFGDSVVYISDDSQKCGHSRIERSQYADCHIVNSHKMYGPKGLAGALVNEKFMYYLRPSVFGGGMIERIGFPNVWKDGIQRYECGSIDVGCCLGWYEACLYMREVGLDEICRQEQMCAQSVRSVLSGNPHVSIVSVNGCSSIVSFYHQEIHAHDIERMFSARNIVVRTGHLCSQTSIAKFGMHPLVRVSFGIGVTTEDLGTLEKAIKGVL